MAEMSEEKDCANKVIFCEPCSCDDLEVIAESFCVNCTEYLCSECTKGHRRSKITRNHKTLDGEELPKDSKTFLLMKKLTSCSDHQDVRMTFQCQDHKAFICTFCLVSKHRKCDNVTEINNLPEGNDELPNHESLEKRILSLRDKLASTVLSKEKNIVTVRSNEERIIKEQEQMIHEIQEYFKKLLEKSTQETKTIAAREIEVLSANIKVMKTLDSKEKEIHDLLLTTREHGTKTECSIINAKVAANMVQLESDMVEFCTDGEVELNFEGNYLYKNIKTIGNISRNEKSWERVVNKDPDRLILEISKSSDVIDASDSSEINEIKDENVSEQQYETCRNIKSVENISRDEQGSRQVGNEDVDRLTLAISTSADAIGAPDSSSCTKTLSSESKQENEPEQQLRPLRKLLEREMNQTELEYNISSSIDTHVCKVSRILILDKARIVLSDTNNNNIKLFDITTKSLLFTFILDAAPIDMCKISNYGLATACRYDKIVSRFSVIDHQLLHDGGFSTKFFPVSLSMVDNIKVVILFSECSDDNNDEDDVAWGKTSWSISDDKIKYIFEIRNITDGQIIETLNEFYSLNGTNKELIHPTRILVVSQNPIRILVAENKFLRCFRAQGFDLREIWFVKSHADVNLFGVTDVVIDSKGNVYACCKDSNNIIQVSSSSYRIIKVLKRIPTRPLALAIDENGGKIYICSKDSNFVRVYDFC